MFDRAVEILEEIGKQLEPPLDNLVPFGYMFIYTENGEVEKAREAIVGAEKLIKGFGQESLMANVYFIEGRLGEITHDYEGAIEKYNLYMELVPTGYTINKNIARCYRHLKEFDKAEDYILIALKHNPYGPQINYEAALLYLDQGKTEKGMDYLDRALKIWEFADPEYKHAAEAVEKYNEIRVSLD
jgi:tetratricopeptide (TPR) repeat protein